MPFSDSDSEDDLAAPIFDFAQALASAEADKAAADKAAADKAAADAADKAAADAADKAAADKAAADEAAKVQAAAAAKAESIRFLTERKKLGKTADFVPTAKAQAVAIEEAFLSNAATGMYDDLTPGALVLVDSFRMQVAKNSKGDPKINYFFEVPLPGEDEVDGEKIIISIACIYDYNVTSKEFFEAFAYMITGWLSDELTSEDYMDYDQHTRSDGTEEIPPGMEHLTRAEKAYYIHVYPIDEANPVDLEEHGVVSEAQALTIEWKHFRHQLTYVNLLESLSCALEMFNDDVPCEEQTALEALRMCYAEEDLEALAAAKKSEQVAK